MDRLTALEWRVILLAVSESTRAAIRAALGEGQSRPANPIPRLNARNIERYVAAVTREMSAGRLDGTTGRAMLYAAQLMVSAVKAGAVKR